MSRSYSRSIRRPSTTAAIFALLLWQLSLPAMATAAQVSTREPTPTRRSATPNGECGTSQFLAEYFMGMLLTDHPDFVRCEAAIQNDSNVRPWPDNGMRPTQFAVRWTGQQEFAAGTYLFSATADDGIRVFLDNVPLIDHWVDQATTTYTATRPVSASTHVVRIEYYQNCCDAVAKVSWRAQSVPVVSIAMPAAPAAVKVGDSVTYSGSALDPEEGPIPPSGLAWQIFFQDCHGTSCVRRPYWRSRGPTDTFTIPDAGDAGAFEFVLTAMNRAGLEATTSVTVPLQSVQILLSSVPSGLRVVYGGTSYVTPVTLTTVPGAVRTIYAPSPQETRTFLSWSDGGAAQHNITVGANPATYTAAFATPSTATLVWATTGAPNALGRPAHVALDGAGNVYVVDSLNHRIQKFDTDGKPVLMWGREGSGDGEFFFREQPDHAAGVTVDRAGNVYVTDFNNHRIQKFDGMGKFLGKWGTQGTGDGQFNFPTGVATDAAGNVYIADSGNDRIQKFDSTGVFLGKWGTHGTGKGQFWGPNGLAVDGQGNVLVADSTNNRIQKFDARGAFLASWGERGTGNGQFNLPFGIVVDGQGRVYVTDNRNSRIQRFDRDGNYLDTFGGAEDGNAAVAFPAGIAIDGQNNAYISERNIGQLKKLRLPQAPQGPSARR